MKIRRWVIWILLPVAAVVIAGGIYAAVEGVRSVVSGSPSNPASEGSSPGALPQNDGARKSENFQIADDAIDGDVSALGDLSPGQAADAASGAASAQAVVTNATVTHVVDGDTIDVTLDTGETARIRMLGVNTPETVDPRRPVECFGKEASAFAKSTLDGKRVRLDADPQADERDIYGRLLRNVTVEDGTDFNATLVREGYAYAYLSFPLDPVRKKQLSDLQKEAETEKRGLWGAACAE